MTTLTNEEIATGFENAAKRLEENGWTQGTDLDAEGRCCAIGAIGYGNSDSTAQLCDIFRMYLRSKHAQRGIVRWNDAEFQTAENVIKTFKEAATYYRNKETENN